MRSSKKRVKIDEIAFGATSLILRYLKENGESEFGMLLRYVNSHLEDDIYSREGLNFRLKRLILERKIARRRYKQGHYLYYITKKGEQNIELVSDIFRNFSYSLLGEHFLDTKVPKKIEDYVSRMIERIGVYMLFAYIFGIIKYTSPKNKMKSNFNNLTEWEYGINPSKQIGHYLFDVSRNFLEFENYEEIIFSDLFDKNSFYDLLHKYLDVIRKSYPDEYHFLDDSTKFLSWHIDDERYNKLSNKEKMTEARNKVRKL